MIRPDREAKVALIVIGCSLAILFMLTWAGWDDTARPHENAPPCVQWSAPPMLYCMEHGVTP